MSVLVNTNFLLRRVQPEHIHHRPAVEALRHYLAAGEVLHITLQTMSESWNVATRPIANNSLGWTTLVVAEQVARIERAMKFVPDTDAVFREGLRLLLRHEVKGVKVHDAKIAAAVIAHGIDRLLTFNTADFARFGIAAVHPTAVVPD